MVKNNKKKVIVIAIILFVILAIYFTVKNVNENARNYEIEKVENYSYFLLNKSELYGVIDKEGNIVIEPDYDEVIIPNPSKNVFICKNENGTKVYDNNNEELFTEYETVEAIELKNIASDLKYEKSILKAKKNGKYGLINFDGKEVLSPEYESIESLSYKEGELLVQKEGKYGVVNIKGTQIIKCEYDTIFSDNYYTDSDEYKYSGYIVGNKTEDGYRYGYINSKGKKILNNEYNEILRVTEIKDNKRIYLISAKNGQYGLIRNGKKIIPNEYNSCIYNQDMNLVIVEKNQSYGAISLEGKIIIPIEYQELEVNGLYMYGKKGQEVMVFDSKGKNVNIDINIYKYSTENENYIITLNNSNNIFTYGVEDKNGNKIIDNKYSYIGYLFDDYFIAGDQNRKMGIIDSNENVKVEFIYDSIQKMFEKEIVKATITGEGGVTKYFDKNGNEVSKPTDSLNNLAPDILGKYHKVTYGFGEFYYTDEQ